MSHHRHQLSEEYQKNKEDLWDEMRFDFAGKDPEFLDHDPDWRLARICFELWNIISKESQLTFRNGDLTLAKKHEDPGAASPQILAYSWRAKTIHKLSITDPIIFLED